jgi:hypothetical protein
LNPDDVRFGVIDRSRLGTGIIAATAQRQGLRIMLGHLRDLVKGGSPRS